MVAGEEEEAVAVAAARVGKDDRHGNTTNLSPAEELLRAAKEAGERDHHGFMAGMFAFRFYE